MIFLQIVIPLELKPEIGGGDGAQDMTSRRGAANTRDGSSHDREESRPRLTVVLAAAGLPLCARLATRR